ncbi:MAG: Rho termination factor N-terminal domain-containing protein [Acidobacteria bacterium]|nr:Rho termination factor N-terminal domain-containing protein [Acidobacteriota bacterium]
MMRKAAELKIPGRSRMNRQQLLRAILRRTRAA